MATKSKKQKFEAIFACFFVFCLVFFGVLLNAAGIAASNVIGRAKQLLNSVVALEVRVGSNKFVLGEGIRGGGVVGELSSSRKHLLLLLLLFFLFPFLPFFFFFFFPFFFIFFFICFCSRGGTGGGEVTIEAVVGFFFVSVSWEVEGVYLEKVRWV